MGTDMDMDMDMDFSGGTGERTLFRKSAAVCVLVPRLHDRPAMKANVLKRKQLPTWIMILCSSTTNRKVDVRSHIQFSLLILFIIAVIVTPDAQCASYAPMLCDNSQFSLPSIDCCRGSSISSLSPPLLLPVQRIASI